MDRTYGLRTLIIDLTYNSVLRRGVVRCPILAMVAEIIKHFMGRSMLVDSPLLESSGEVVERFMFIVPFKYRLLLMGHISR